MAAGDRVVDAFVDDPLEPEDLLTDRHIVEEVCVVEANDVPRDDGGPIAVTLWNEPDVPTRMMMTNPVGGAICVGISCQST